MSRHIKIATNGELIDEESVQDGSPILNQDNISPDDDPINSPSHYQSYIKGQNIECIDCMRAAFGDDAVKDFCRINAFKYLYRSSSKGQNTDIKKAQWYLSKFLELGGYE